MHNGMHANLSSTAADMELGQWVIFYIRVIILTRCETRVFPVFKKNAQNAKHTFEMLKL